MKNHEKTLLVVVSLLFFVVACSKPDESNQTPSTPAPNSTEQMIPNPEQALIAGPTITIIGEGNNILSTNGGGNCSPTSGGIKAEVSIVGGAAGNAIDVTAACALGSGASATASATDVGGPAVVATKSGNPGRGRASCTHVFTSAGMPDSAWTAVCSF